MAEGRVLLVEDNKVNQLLGRTLLQKARMVVAVAENGHQAVAALMAPDADFEEVRCATMGVFAPLVGIIGTLQAAEALKLLCGAGRSLAGRLLMLDGRTMEWTELSLPRDASCPVCGGA